MAESKTFATCMIIDWKSGKFRVTKRKPKSFKPSEIPINFSVKINVPSQPEINASGEITLTETKYSEIVVDAI